MKFNLVKMKRRFFVLLLAAFAAASLSACGTKLVDAKQDIKNVKVIRAANSSVNIGVEYAGKIKPLEEVSIASKIPGTVLSIAADIGSEVEKGQVLFTIDPKDAKAQLQQSKAAVDNADANYTRIKDSSISQQILELEAAENQAQIQYDDAKSFYEKMQSLYNAEVISKQEMDNAESSYKNAGIQLNTTQENLKLLKEKGAPQTTAVAAAQLEQAQAAYNLAFIQVNDTTVTAPISGVVALRNISEGELTSSAVPAFTIIDIKTIIVEISIPDNFVSKIQSGQKLIVKIDALEGKSFEGIVDTVSPAADSRTQLYTVKLKIDNADNAIKPGMFARVTLPMESKENVLTVPNEAIVVEDGTQYVYLVIDNKVKKTAVTVGLSNDSLTEIISGIKAGDLIISEGQSFLNDGEAVKINE